MTFTEGEPDVSVGSGQHELAEFLSQVSVQLAAEYTRIRRRAREDPGTAGDEGEENWRDLLVDWLPPDLHVVTKGRILGHNGEISPQVDLLVLRPGYPRSLRNKKTYLAGGVLAAFECKLTLRAEHVRAAMATAKTIRSLVAPRFGSPHAEIATPLLFGLLAHTTSLRRDPLGRIDQILDAGLSIAGRPGDALSVVCVADLATWRFWPLLLPRAGVNPQAWEGIRGTHELAEDGGLRGFYMRWLGWQGNEVAPNPLYVLIQHLLHHAAWETPTYRELARYWDLTLQGGSTSVCAKTWPLSILSEAVREGVRRGGLTQGDPWSEWGMLP